MRGGKRPGAGRKQGQVADKTKLRVAVAEKALQEGISPLDYLLSILRDAEQGQAARFAAAKEAAPYIHPRLAAVDHSGSMSITTQEQAMAEIEQAASQLEADGKPN